MAYVSVAEWRPEQVTEWLKGLDSSILSYIHWFSSNEVNGQQLLNLSPDDLTHLGVCKLGHQELILEAVQHLRNFHYELDRENLQVLALRLSCAACSLYSEIKFQGESSSVPTQVMSDVANIIHNVKPLVSWLDRPPFAGQILYASFKSELLTLSLEMATCAQRDRFAEKPVAKIRSCCTKLANLADSIIQDVSDPMILQPATLDIVTIKKKAGEDLDFFLIPSFHGVHQIGDMKLSSPAHQSGKIQQGDEIVQVNYQTVVGWSRKKVLALFEESPSDLLITLKRRPRHVKMYGQIYMKPYRLPSQKRALPYSRWNDSLPSPRPELLTIPHFDLAMLSNLSKTGENNQPLSEPSDSSSSSDEEFGHLSDCRNSAAMRLYLPKPRVPLQRRFTLSGPPRPSAQSEQFWRELQLERSWRSSQNNSRVNNSSEQNVAAKEGDIDEMFQLRDKSASLGNSIATNSAECGSFSKVRMGTVKFDLTKFDSSKNESPNKDKTLEEKDKDVSETVVNSPGDNNEKEGTEIDFDTTPNPTNQENFTFTELNKLKRDDFSNVSDGENAQDVNKSGDFEGVEENLKTDVAKAKKDTSEVEVLKSPGKVMELIENFERAKSKEYDAGEKFKPSKKEKNRLDKSCSTPTYYATDTETPPEWENYYLEYIHVYPMCNFQITPNKTILCGKNRNIKSDWKFDAEKVEEKLKIYERSKSLEKKQNKENIQGESYESDPFDENVCNISNQSSPSEDFSSESTSLCGSETVKPVPAQRKSKLPPKNSPGSPPCPLPPKPRSKPLPLTPKRTLSRSLSEQFAPEPPPRPDATFAKSPTKSVDIKDTEEMARDFGSAESNLRSKMVSSSTLPELRSNLLDLKSSGPMSPSFRKISKPFGNILSPVEKEKPKSSGTLESLKAMLTLGRKSGNVNSPRSLRKKNATLAKKRNVGAKEITSFENSGFLWHRNRKGLAAASWMRYYFILQGSNFYGFKSKESHKADLFIHLPGFTCTLAEEVKSKEFSFKIYHTGLLKSLHINSNPTNSDKNQSSKNTRQTLTDGWSECNKPLKSTTTILTQQTTRTVFYFAADSTEDLQQWLDSVNLAISFQDDKSVPDAVTYSQTDSDGSGTDPEPETCFPTSPKMKKVLGSSPPPKPARSHQNLASESKKTQDVQRRFGSLKKLNPQKHARSGECSSGKNESPEIASLDRKYLGFLGKNSPTPVPTSRFRSYRRLQPPTIPLKGKTKPKIKNLEIHSESQIQAAYNKARLAKIPLHSSNPSLVFPDMNDYGIAEKTRAEFRKFKNQINNVDECQSIKNDESLEFFRNKLQDSNGFMTLEQFLFYKENERQRLKKLREGQTEGNELSEREQTAHEGRSHKYENKHKDFQSRQGQNTSNDSKEVKSEKSQGSQKSKSSGAGGGKSRNSSCESSPCSYPPSTSTQNDSDRMDSNLGFVKNQEKKKPEWSERSKNAGPECQDVEPVPNDEAETQNDSSFMIHQRRDSETNNS